MDDTDPTPPNRLRLLGLTLALGAIAGLGGCGGGGDAAAPVPEAAATPAPEAAAAPSPAPGPAPAPTPAPAPSPSPAPAPPPATPGSRATCGLASFEADAMALINAHRAAGAQCGSQGSFKATAPLAWNNALTQAALRHSDDMVANNFFSHTGSDGSSAGDRATAAGYIWSTWGENIAAGQPTVSSVVAGWMASPGHCANIMRERFRDIGLACVAGTATNGYRTYWTMTLGAAR